MYILELIEDAIARNATDLHLSTGDKVAFRHQNGDLTFEEGLRMPQDSDLEALLSQLPGHSATSAAFQRSKHISATVQVGDHQRVRLLISRHHCGWSIACRLLPRDIKSLAEIEAPQSLIDSLNVRSGLIIASGPAGSGKSTTLTAMIDELNRTQRLHILTVEDPIEQLHKSAMSLVRQKEVPRDVASFEDALHDGLRENLDVLMLGELRSARELRAAVTAADTGLLVLASLHARTAPGAVQRLTDAFPAGEKDLARSMIADSLRFFVAQALVKTSDGKGRVGVFETMTNTPAVRNLIRSGELSQLESAIQTGREYGMMTLKQSMTDRIRSGMISESDADHILRGRNS